MNSEPPPSRKTADYGRLVRWLERFGKGMAIVTFALVASHFALKFGSGGLWRGLGAAHAVAGDASPSKTYDLTRLAAVTETLKKIRDKYVDPQRIKPREMFLSALNEVQKEVAQVIVLHDEGSPSVKIRVDTEEREYRVDTIQGPWDVAARLREVFTFLQQRLQGTEVKLDEVEYAACNGMLETLDPHSVFLSPEAYDEMNLSTSGHFGGLGIVISIRDQMLTVMRPMPETPAGRAGLKRLDRITKINNESTLNMPLDDAVERLRGKPGSKVTVWVHRDGKDGWRDSRPFVLVREVIRIKSVESRELAAGIGYVRLKQFQASTDDELGEALDGFRKTGAIKGLVLDLRGNPGGLLDQAARVADRFLSKGVIVATVGNSEGREEKHAERRGTEPDYPIVLLTDGSSASASEIVAGALKNHDRAVIVGQRTFGKGSVQLVFSNVSGGAALKLTIAQYLTPGDVSIQGVGVTPDVELDPMTADTLEMDLFRSEHRFSERELDKSLTHESARNTDRPLLTLRYNFPESERAEWREQGNQVGDDFALDFPIRFGRDLVGRLPFGKPRDHQLVSARPFIDGVQEVEVAALTKDLSNLGLDWSAPPKGTKGGPTATELVVKVETDKPSNRVLAGEPMALKVSVTNSAQAPAYQVRAITKSDAGYYDERELILGKIDPGQTVTASVPLGFCKIEGRQAGTSEPVPLDAPRTCFLPPDAVTREDVIKVRFSREGGPPPQDAEIRATVESLPQPNFAYTYQIADTANANGDGQLQLGESATMYLDVINTGKGTSRETQALLRNLTGDGLLLRAGRFDISNMKPGERRQVAFTFDVLGTLAENVAKVELSVVDRDLRVAAAEKVTLPIVTGGLFVKPEKADVEVTRRAPLRPQPVAGAGVFGVLEPGAIVQQVGVFGEFSKVVLDNQRFAFVENDALKAGKGSALKFVPFLTHSPPTLEVASPSLSTRDATIEISGLAKDADQILDVYMFVGAHKVFYQSNRNGADVKQLAFKHVLQLQPGINIINVVARESEEVATAQTLVVRRDGPNGEALSSPKGAVFGADWSFSDEE
jgi:carboxyl-terminal processing protease